MQCVQVRFKTSFADSPAPHFRSRDDAPLVEHTSGATVGCGDCSWEGDFPASFRALAPLQRSNHSNLLVMDSIPKMILQNMFFLVMDSIPKINFKKGSQWILQPLGKSHRSHRFHRPKLGPSSPVLWYRSWASDR